MNIFEIGKHNLSAVDVVIRAGFKPNRGNMICCPFHKDRSPSMKVDKRYFCFRCGAKGDAIDFVANYYGLSPKEAAIKIVSDVGLTYDKIYSPDSMRKKLAIKKNEYRIWNEKKKELFERLSELHEKSRAIKNEYVPKDIGDSNWNPLFSMAAKEFDYLDYLYDYYMFEATEDELKTKYEEIKKEIEKIEERIIDTESGAGKSDVRQVGERMAI